MARLLILALSTTAASALVTNVMMKAKEDHWRWLRHDGIAALGDRAPAADEWCDFVWEYVLLSTRERRGTLFHIRAAISLATCRYNQTLDHFNILNQGYWQQRFWVNEQYYNGTGPLFLYVEGEGAGSPYSVVSGQHVELAVNHSALVVSLEHRFYGASIPTTNLSVENLAYLSSGQAIADVAKFLSDYVPSRWPGVTKTVTFGGSYPGVLSAWLRLRLPHLVHAAFSTSSPVEAIVDFTGYSDTVAYAMSYASVGGSPACLASLKSAFAAIDTAFRGSDAQKTAMSQKLHSCAPALSDNDVMWAVSNLASYVMGLVQYNNIARVPNVASVCADMTAPGVEPIDAFATVIAASVGSGCMDNSYDNFVALLSDTTAHPDASGVGIRQWTWQTCAEFAFYQSCEEGTACPFSTLMTLDSSFQQCVDGFDVRMSKDVNVAAVNATNAYMGAKRIVNGTSRVLFVNGGVDPWHTLSVNIPDVTTPANAAVFMPASSHCRAMSSSNADDPAEVKAARAASAAVLADWLAI